MKIFLNPCDASCLPNLFSKHYIKCFKSQILNCFAFLKVSEKGEFLDFLKLQPNHHENLKKMCFCMATDVVLKVSYIFLRA